MKWKDMLPNINRVDEGAQPDYPIDWWYYNDILSSPGNPVDGWAFIVIYTIFPRNVSESVTALLVRPDANPINLSQTGLSPGDIKTSVEGCDVSCGKNWYRGAYPNWKTHFEGKDDKQSYQIDLEATADVSSLFLRVDFDPSFWNQFVVYHHLSKGTLTVGNKTYPVTGYGYNEHVYGVFDFKASRGWHWFCVPETEKDQLVANMRFKINSKYEFPDRNFTFTVDGKNFGYFEDVKFKMLEEKEYKGQKYPSKFHMEEKRNEGELSAIITREPYALMRFEDSPVATALFVTGYARLEGKVSWEGKEYDLAGRSIGSTAILNPK